MNQTDLTQVGLGSVSDQACINVYIANRPPLDEYQQLSWLKALNKGDVYSIAQLTGNHWRKIFNVYAKFLYGFYESGQSLLPAIDLQQIPTWQNYRDEVLLQSSCKNTLLFSAPVLSQDTNKKNQVHIVMGKQYAAQLGFDRDCNKELVIVDNDFALCPTKNLIICPYFDYRQLSNIKIEQLIALVNQLVKNKVDVNKYQVGNPYVG